MRFAQPAEAGSQFVGRAIGRAKLRAHWSASSAEPTVLVTAAYNRAFAKNHLVSSFWAQWHGLLFSFGMQRNHSQHGCIQARKAAIHLAAERQLIGRSITSP